MKPRCTRHVRFYLDVFLNTINMTCNKLFKVSCETPSDLMPLNLSELRPDRDYIAYNAREGCLWGFLIIFSKPCDDDYDTLIEVLKQFGP